MSEEVQQSQSGEDEGTAESAEHVEPHHAHHKISLPAERSSITHHVTVYADNGDADIYITVGFYDNKLPGELFISIGKAGSSLRGALDSWARMVSIGLQWGVPVDDIVDKFKSIAFEPSGPTSNEAIPRCMSPIDYAMRWLEGTMSSAKV